MDVLVVCGLCSETFKSNIQCTKQVILEEELESTLLSLFELQCMVMLNNCTG